MNALLTLPLRFFQWVFADRRRTLIAFGVILLYRIAYGLTEKFWDTDELQSYLIGLRAYASDEWPAWGPDSMYKVPSRLAGGLMGSVIMVALKLLPIPESPVVLLNILSFSSLLFLGWFLTQRLEKLPKWMVWMYVLTSPWTLHFSTYIINPSFVLLGSVCFFVPWMDRTKWIGEPMLDLRIAYALMGFALMWVFQVHMSWVLIGPFGVWLILKERYTIGSFAQATFSFLGGAILASITLLPTLDALWKDPLGGTENNILFNAKNLLYLPEFAGRYLAMGTFEIARYSSHIELLFQQVERQPWIIPLAAALILASVLQVVFMVYFIVKNRSEDARKIKQVLLISGAVVFSSFLFSIKPPISYTFYFIFPLITTLSLAAYALYVDRWKLKEWFSWLFVLSVVFHITHMFFGFNFKSIYTDRGRARLAIEEKEHLVMGARRLAYFEKPDLSELFMTEGDALTSSFEYTNAATRPQFISDRRSVEGKYALVMTDRAPYSPSFQMKLPKEGSTLRISFSYWSLYQDTITLVTERKEDQFWKATTIQLSPNHEGQWQSKDFELSLPNSDEKSSFKMYFWKDSETMNLIYLDELVVEPLHAVSEVDQGQ